MYLLSDMRLYSGLETIIHVLFSSALICVSCVQYKDCHLVQYDAALSSSWGPTYVYVSENAHLKYGFELKNRKHNVNLHPNFSVPKLLPLWLKSFRSGLHL